MTPRGNRLCSSHMDVVPCSSCGRPARTHDSREPESITLCPVCQKNSVETGQALKACVRKVCRGMNHLGFPLGARKIKASLTDEEGIRRHMVALSDKLPSALVVGKGSSSQEVLVRAGLSDEHTMALLSHELFHVWLIRNGIQVDEPVLLEGLCEYMQWLWLRRRHHKEDARYRCKLLETNPDEIYGGGFRNCRSAVQLTGSFGSLIEHVRTKKSFPHKETVRTT
uniref:Protein DA1-like domain-containing protein n=2 Tax=Rhodosorus marinus TaxID=101924 RepID=A0A7S3A282_9RHOD|mmetsp:Transcript_38083/g.151163  ORF Transcript_38083/g.151163 Transcript_38083/m.151163 type:complete len:225 (+) Transcript_38083:982-1656(+)